MVVRYLKTIGFNLADTIGRYMALLAAVNILKKKQCTILHKTAMWRVVERIPAMQTLCFSPLGRSER